MSERPVQPRIGSAPRGGAIRLDACITLLHRRARTEARAGIAREREDCMIESHVTIAAPDGAIPVFVCRPERGGPAPVALFLMDAPGMREELRDMARRLATVGYYVMLPNLYYRGGVDELPAVDLAERRALITRLREPLTIPAVMEDCAALMAHAGADPAASPGPAGAVGYCMSGPYAIGAAARFPGRVMAAASFHGVALATDAPDSPHRAIRGTAARLYFGCAEHDAYIPPEMVERLRAEAQGTTAEVEMYPGTEHGFVFPQREAYVKAAAERHWERLLALFAGLRAPFAGLRAPGG